MESKTQKKLEKIDNKLKKMQTKQYPVWFYESYVEYRYNKLAKKKQQLENQRTQ